MLRNPAPAFAASLFQPDERVAIVLIPRGEPPVPARTTQRIFAREKLASPKVQSWLRYCNSKAADVYIGMNPIRPGALGRHKADIAEVKRVYIDIDEGGPAALAKLDADVRAGRTPRPQHIIETSPGHSQVIWTLAERPEPAAAEHLMRQLVARYGADPAATDVSRVLRYPGFRNHKRDRFLASLSSPDGEPTRLDAFRDLPRIERAQGARAGEPSVGGGHRSQSERDWAEVNRRLRAGESPRAIEAWLAGHRADKPNPGYYARRTVQRAEQQSVARSR